MPRKIMSAFTFSDGTHIPANNWVVVPQQAQMKDPSYYPDPEKFNGFRFIHEQGKDASSESRLSHPSWRFPFWGSVKQAWSVTYPLSLSSQNGPVFLRFSIVRAYELADFGLYSPARFYVTDMTKLILQDFVMNYDIKLEDENIPNSFAWGPLRVPHPRLVFLMQKRAKTAA